MYLVNQKANYCIKFCFFIGLPLLSSFVIDTLASYQLLSITLVAIAYLMGHLYPEKISIYDYHLSIKLFLTKEWIDIPLANLRVVQEGKMLSLGHDQKKMVYKISSEKLSVRLYQQLRPYIKEDDINS